MRPNTEKSVRISRLLRHLRRQGKISLPDTVEVDQIQLHQDGRHFFDALFMAISEASTLICLEYYRISDDSTGKRLAGLLEEAIGRGVQVFLIYDAIGCHKTDDAYFENLSQKGIRCISFNPLSLKRGILWFDRRDHRKMAVIDGKLAFLGGLNIADEYAGLGSIPSRYRDVGFSMHGRAAIILMEHFSDIWNIEVGTPPNLPTINVPPQQQAAAVARIAFVTGGPHQRRSAIRAAFRFAMASATDELLVANPYFIPGPLIIRSLLKAAKRGVKIRLLLPARSDVPIVRLLSRSSYDPLLRAGIEIFELERELLHAKLMYIDGERTVIGSANLDQRSFHRNFEINAIISSRPFASQVKNLFESDFSHSRCITLDEHSRRGISAIIMEHLLRPICWFL